MKCSTHTDIMNTDTHKPLAFLVRHQESYYLHNVLPEKKRITKLTLHHISICYTIAARGLRVVHEWPVLIGHEGIRIHKYMLY